MTQWTLDRLVPAWDHREVHHRVVPATRERVWDVLWDLRIRDLPVTQVLSRLRTGPGGWTSGSASRRDRRVLDSIAPQVLVCDRPDELVLVDVARYTARKPAHPDRGDWTPEEFVGFAEPGWSKVGMNFRLTEVEGGTDLCTETRVVSTDAATRRAFTGYWLPVRLGSGMVRREVLYAVKARSMGRETT